MTTTIGRTDDPVRIICARWVRRAAVARGRNRDRQAHRGWPRDDDRGICENPLTIRAIIGWRDALNEEKMLLRRHYRSSDAHTQRRV